MADDLMYDKLKATAIAHIRAFEDTSGPRGTPYDADNIYKYRTSDCVMRFHPGEGMPPPLNGPVARDHHEPATDMLGDVIVSSLTDIHEITVDVKRRVVAARMTINFIFKGVKEDPQERLYPITYVWITEMEESGERICRMEEYLDTNRARFMLERAGKYHEENGKK